MFNGIAIAFTIISACILITKRFEHRFIIDASDKTGQLALTFYVAHIMIGVGVFEMINPSKMGEYSVEFSVTWRKYKRYGPLEWIMRKATDYNKIGSPISCN